MTLPAFIYHLLLITALLIRLASAQGLAVSGVMPVMYGIGDVSRGLGIEAQGEVLTIKSQALASGCYSGLHCAMQDNGVVQAELHPDTLKVIPGPGVIWSETTVYLVPTNTLSTVVASDPVLSQFPASLWFNPLTLEWLAAMIGQVVAVLSLDEVQDNPDDTIDPVFVTPTPVEKMALTTIAVYQDGEGDLWSTTAVPTPTPEINREWGDSKVDIRLEFEEGVTGIQPSTTQSNGSSHSGKYTAVVTPRQVPTSTGSWAEGTSSAGSRATTTTEPKASNSPVSYGQGAECPSARKEGSPSAATKRPAAEPVTAEKRPRLNEDEDTLWEAFKEKHHFISEYKYAFIRHKYGNYYQERELIRDGKEYIQSRWRRSREEVLENQKLWEKFKTWEVIGDTSRERCLRSIFFKQQREKQKALETNDYFYFQESTNLMMG